MGLPLDKPTYELLGEGKLPVAMPAAFEFVDPFLPGDSKWVLSKPVPTLTHTSG